jgi:hypothetical protein
MKGVPSGDTILPRTWDVGTSGASSSCQYLSKEARGRGQCTGAAGVRCLLRFDCFDCVFAGSDGAGTIGAE